MYAFSLGALRVLALIRSKTHQEEQQPSTGNEDRQAKRAKQADLAHLTVL
jgi:hypothetical protein